MNRELAERVEQIRKYKRVPIEVFATRIGVSRQTAHAWNNGKYYPSHRQVINIIQVFEDVSADWLLSGYGGMLKADAVTFNPLISSGSIDELVQAKDLEIAYLKKQLRDKEEIIDLLKLQRANPVQ